MVMLRDLFACSKLDAAGQPVEQSGKLHQFGLRLSVITLLCANLETWLAFRTGQSPLLASNSDSALVVQSAQTSATIALAQFSSNGARVGIRSAAAIQGVLAAY